MNKTWLIDFQADAGGMHNSADPITCTFDMGCGGCWNAFQICAIRTDEHFQDGLSITQLRAATGEVTQVSFLVSGRMRAYNDPLINEGGAASLNSALGDHITFAHGAASERLEFTFNGLEPGEYELTVYANPTEHPMGRAFATTVGDHVLRIEPSYEGAPTVKLHGRDVRVASVEQASGKISPITVDHHGTIPGRFDKIGDDPSIAALRLVQLSAG